MKKVTAEMIKYHNSVSKVLKIHYRGHRVCAYLSNGSKIFGEVSVKKDRLYINREMMEDKIITQLFCTIRNGNGKNCIKKRRQE